MQRILFFFLFSLIEVFPSHAQVSRVSIGTQIPLNYSIGYEYEFQNNLGIQGQIGLLTKPYDKAILGVMKAFGSDEAIVNTIGQAFTYGGVAQIGLRYHRKDWVFGIHTSFYSLNAHETPVGLLEVYYNVSLPPRVRSHAIALNSKLYNAGVSAGYELKLKDDRNRVLFEFAFAKTFASANLLMSEYGDLKRLGDLVNEELKSYFLQYGYLPSINIFYTRTF